MLSALVAGEAVLKRWSQYFWLLVLGFAFAMLPVMLAMPTPALIADSALLFTLMSYALFSRVFVPFALNCSIN